MREQQITTRADLLRRWGELKTERSSWMPHWKELSQFLLPRSGRYFIQDRNRGARRHNQIYDSTGTGQPATPDVAVTTQVKLASLPLNATAYGAASGGTKTANAITSGTGLAAGTATWARFYKSDHTTAVHDCSVGTSGCDINLNDAAITIGGTVSVTAYTVSMPVAQ